MSAETSPTSNPVPPDSPSHASSVHRRQLAFAGAIGVLVLIGVVSLLLHKPSAGPPSEAASPKEIAAFATSLGRKRPDLFAGFTPLAAAEFVTRVVPPREGPSLFEPTGPTDQDRPTFRFGFVPAARDLRIELRRTDDDSAVWSREVGDSASSGSPTPSVPFEYPADAPALARGGTYGWILTGTSLTGPIRSSTTFHVTTDAERSRRDQAVALLLAGAPGALGRLTAVHFLVRSGWMAEAEKAVRAHLGSVPDDPAGRTLLVHILAKRGSPQGGRTP